MNNDIYQHAIDDAVKQQPSSSFSSQSEAQERYVPEQESWRSPTATREEKKKNKTGADKRLVATGLIFLVLCIGATFFTPSTAVDSSPNAVLALENGYSTVLPLGTRLLSEDQSLGGMDMTITHSSAAEETKIHIWDYAAEDGDYVQVLINGAPLGDPFMIYNEPVSLTVPSAGEITILGTHDGGGGITYAIHYDVNGTTYYNGTDVGNGNVYTLICE